MKDLFSPIYTSYDEYIMNALSYINISKLKQYKFRSLLVEIQDYLLNKYDIIISVAPRTDGFTPNIYNGCYLVIWRDGTDWIYDNQDNGNYWDMIALGEKIVLEKIKNGELS